MSSTNSVISGLRKFLANFFFKLLGSVSDSQVIKSVFMKVPIHGFLQYLQDLFVGWALISPNTILDLFSLIEFGLVNNFFQFDNRFYKQIFGASLGSSQSIGNFFKIRYNPLHVNPQ